MADKKPKLSKLEIKMKEKYTMADATKIVSSCGWFFISVLCLCLLFLGGQSFFEIEFSGAVDSMLGRLFVIAWCVIVMLDARILRTFFGARRLSPVWWAIGTYLLAPISMIYMFLRRKYFKGELKAKAHNQAVVSAILWVGIIALVFFQIFVSTNQAPNCWDPDVKELFVNALEDSGLGDVKVGNIVEESKVGWDRVCAAFNVEYKIKESGKTMSEDRIFYIVQIVDGEDGPSVLVSIP